MGKEIPVNALAGAPRNCTGADCALRTHGSSSRTKIQNSNVRRAPATWAVSNMMELSLDSRTKGIRRQPSVLNPHKILRRARNKRYRAGVYSGVHMEHWVYFHSQYAEGPMPPCFPVPAVLRLSSQRICRKAGFVSSYSRRKFLETSSSTHGTLARGQRFALPEASTIEAPSDLVLWSDLRTDGTLS